MSIFQKNTNSYIQRLENQEFTINNNTFSSIFTLFKNNRKSVKDYISLLNEKINIDLEYIKRLKKLYDTSNIIQSSSKLTDYIGNIREYINNLSLYCTEYVECCKKEVISPLEEILSSQFDNQNRIEKEYKKLEKEYKDSLISIEKAKNKYYQVSQQAELTIKDYETAKVLKINNDYEKLSQKSIQVLKEAKELEKLYFNQLLIGKEQMTKFENENFKKISDIEEFDRRFSRLCKETFQKFIIFTNVYTYNQNYDIDKLKFALGEIDFEKELDSFKNKEKENIIDVNKEIIDHLKYKGYAPQLKSKPIYEYNNIPYEIVLNTIKTINENLEVNIIDGVWNYEEELNKIKIYEISNMIFTGGVIEDYKKDELVSLIHLKKYRNFFLQTINNFRIKLEIPMDTFDFLGQIFIKIILDIEKDYDYESIKTIIILSQTFSSSGVPLKSYIKGMSVFDNQTFWESYVACKSNIFKLIYMYMLYMIKYVILI